MRFKFRFIIINRLLWLFLSLIALFFIMTLGILWFFKIDVTAQGSGVVKCRNWIDIKPQISGIIHEMRVEEGKWVEPGDLLFALDDREQKLNAAAAELDIEELKISISKIKSRLIQAKSTITEEIDAAGANLRAAAAKRRIITKGPKPEEIALARTRIKRFEIQFEKAKRDYKKKKRAFSKNLISQQELDIIAHRKELAEVDLEMTNLELKLLLNKYDIDQAVIALAEEDRYRAIFNNTLARENELDILRNELKSAKKSMVQKEKELALLQEHVTQTRIEAPVEGYVLTHDTEHLAGKAVVKGEVVLRIGDSRDYVIDCRISENDFPLIAFGQEAKVQIKPFPRGEYKLFKAKVIQVGADINSTGSGNILNSMAGAYGMGGNPGSSKGGFFPVILDLEKPYVIHIYDDLYEIKPGFSAEVEIVIRKERMLSFLLRRILRIKGRLTPDNIHL